VIDAVVDQAERVGRGEVVEFVNSPIRTLTNTIAGFRAGKVYILAARPGMGKTSFAGQCLYEASKEGAALFVSLEMTEEDIARRLFTVVNESLYADTMFSKGIRTNAERKEVQQAAADLKKLNIHIQSEFSTLQGLKTLIKSKVRAHGVKFVVVDYLQLVTPDKPLGNREQEISTISRELKKLSLELKIPILVLSQLSRKCEERGNKRPLLSDLRDSGAIEQDADAVMFLYRDSVYSGEIDDDSAEIIVAKNRNGGLGVVNCRFIGERMVYKDDSLPPNVHEVYKQTQLPTDDNPF
jgi:replicative DNA helicase